jgi:hypothetical protein
VPSPAETRMPERSDWAPVKAPFTWPKSSLSSTPSFSAAQLTGRKGAPARVLRRWSARATSSLPVPLSPVMRTVVRLGATFSTRPHTAFIAWLSPTHSPPRPPLRERRSCRFSSRSPRFSRAFWTSSFSSSLSNGLQM